MEEKSHNTKTSKIVDETNCSNNKQNDVEIITQNFSYHVNILYKQLSHYYLKLFGIFSRHQTQFEVSFIAYQWITYSYLLRSNPVSNVYTKMLLSMKQFMKLGMMYSLYYMFRISVVKRWQNGTSPNIHLDFNGCYSILKQLFAFKAFLEINLPNLITISVNIQLKNHNNTEKIVQNNNNNNNNALIENKYVSQQVVVKNVEEKEKVKTTTTNFIENKTTKTEVVEDYSTNFNKDMIDNEENEEEILLKKPSNCPPTTTTTINSINNKKGKSTVIPPKKQNMPVNPLLSQIRQFNTQSLTPPRKKLINENSDDVDHVNENGGFFSPSKGKHSMFADLAAGLKKRRARLSTAVFKTKGALANRGVYDDDDDSDEDDDDSSDGHRWSTGTDESDIITRANIQVDNVEKKDDELALTSIKPSANIKVTEKENKNNSSRIMTPELVNMFSPPPKFQHYNSNNKMFDGFSSSSAVKGKHSKLCNNVDSTPEKNNENIIVTNNSNPIKEQPPIMDGNLLSEIRNFNSNINHQNKKKQNTQSPTTKIDTMNKKNDNDIKMKNEENFKLDKRLSINNENICISSPRRNGRRNRSRRHLIYVPSLSNNDEVVE